MHSIESCLFSDESLFQAKPIGKLPCENKQAFKNKVCKLAKRVFSVPVKPFRSVGRVTHGLIGEFFILPAQMSKKTGVSPYLNTQFYNQSHEGPPPADCVYFKSSDSALINGVFIRGLRQRSNGTDLQLNDKKAPTVIMVNGNADTMEFHLFAEIENNTASSVGLLEHYRKAGFNVLLFNFRNVQGSKAPPNQTYATCKGLVRDVEAAIQYVRDHLGVAESDILVHGHSLGAAVAAEAAVHFPTLNFIHERSFKSLFSEVKEFVALEAHVAIACKLGDKLYSIKSIQKSVRGLSQRVGAAAAYLVHMSGWQYNPEKAMKKMKGRKCVVLHSQDAMVPANARISDSDSIPNCTFLDLSTAPTHIQRSTSVDNLELQFHEGLEEHNRDMNYLELERVMRVFQPNR